MIDVVVHLRVAGSVLVAIGLLHAFLPAALGWGADLAAVSRVTRQVSYVHCFFVGLTCLLFGALAIAHAESLATGGPLATTVLAGLVVFWGARLGIQLFVFDSALWRGEPFRTAVHVVLAATWAYETAVFAAALGQQVA